MVVCCCASSSGNTVVMMELNGGIQRTEERETENWRERDTKRTGERETLRELERERKRDIELEKKEHQTDRAQASSSSMVSCCVGVWIPGPPATSLAALQTCGGQTRGQFKRTLLHHYHPIQTV